MEVRKIRVLRNGAWRKPKESETEFLAREIDLKLYEFGFYGYAEVVGRTRIRVRNVRINRESKTLRWTSNKSGFTGIYGNCLNYWQWGLINVMLNVLCDVNGYSANIESLNGKFVIRDGTITYDFYDWADMEWENVGSIVDPVYWREHWSPKSYEVFSRVMDACFMKLRAYVNATHCGLSIKSKDEIIRYVERNYYYVVSNCPFYVKNARVIEYEE